MPLFNFSVVEGKSVELPCNISPPGFDTLDMVIWFKDESGLAIYSYVLIYKVTYSKFFFNYNTIYLWLNLQNSSFHSSRRDILIGTLMELKIHNYKPKSVAISEISEKRFKCLRSRSKSKKPVQEIRSW